MGNAEASVLKEMPGPGSYLVNDYASALNSARQSSGFGTASRSSEAGLFRTDIHHQLMESVEKPRRYDDRGTENAGGVPYDSGDDIRLRKAPCAIFGTESRDAEVADFDLLKSNPES
ncbi:unnamed protein product, partial [Polarella glacialis]